MSDLKIFSWGGDNLISVIVPVLNSERYIDRCIRSILEQTYQDIELLLVVGISSDSSIENALNGKEKTNV